MTSTLYRTMHVVILTVYVLCTIAFGLQLWSERYRPHPKRRRRVNLRFVYARVGIIWSILGVAQFIDPYSEFFYPTELPNYLQTLIAGTMLCGACMSFYVAIRLAFTVLKRFTRFVRFAKVYYITVSTMSIVFAQLVIPVRLFITSVAFYSYGLWLIWISFVVITGVIIWDIALLRLRYKIKHVHRNLTDVANTRRTSMSPKNSTRSASIMSVSLKSPASRAKPSSSSRSLSADSDPPPEATDGANDAITQAFKHYFSLLVGLNCVALLATPGCVLVAAREWREQNEFESLDADSNTLQIRATFPLLLLCTELLVLWFMWRPLPSWEEFKRGPQPSEVSRNSSRGSRNNNNSQNSRVHLSIIDKRKRRNLAHFASARRLNSVKRLSYSLGSTTANTTEDKTTSREPSRVPAEDEPSRMATALDREVHVEASILRASVNTSRVDSRGRPRADSDSIVRSLSRNPLFGKEISSMDVVTALKTSKDDLLTEAVQRVRDRARSQSQGNSPVGSTFDPDDMKQPLREPDEEEEEEEEKKAADLKPIMPSLGLLPLKPSVLVQASSRSPRQAKAFALRHRWLKPNIPVEVIAGSYVHARGTVRFVGDVHFASGTWVGVELRDKDGTCDGSYRGQRYFNTKDNRGVFLKPASLLPLEDVSNI